MHVIATAGHVDHGKSTLVRALTGAEPDRWAEERRRGLSIGLGYAWTTIDDVGEVAFVDVPGHERFVSTMLGGVGQIPAVLFVVAADEGWMPQSTEHLAVLDALDVRHGLLVVTRADLSEPELAMEEAGLELAGTSLESIPRIGVSASTGAGIPELKAAIADLVRALPEVDATAPVRLWVDRSFSIRGAGTVVTGTLPAGTVRQGDRLRVAGTDRDVGVREVQCLGEVVEEVSGVARVALNLRGADPELVPRGAALITDGSWTMSSLADVRLFHRDDDADPLPQEVTVHAGSDAVPARVRTLADGLARLQLARPLPLHIGDRLLARDPGNRRVVGIGVLDPLPPPLDRRGSQRRRAAVLTEHGGVPDVGEELVRRGPVRASVLEAMGVEVDQDRLTGDWLVDADLVQTLVRRLIELVEERRAQQPLDAGLSVEEVRQRLELPDREIVAALAERTEGRVELRAGRLSTADDSVPEELQQVIAPLLERLVAEPFVAPDSDTLAGWGIGARELSAAERAGMLVRIAEGVVLAVDAPDRAVVELRALPQPFTLSEARELLGTSRRVAVPLLELLQRAGKTRRVGDRHEVVEPG